MRFFYFIHICIYVRPFKIGRAVLILFLIQPDLPLYFFVELSGGPAIHVRKSRGSAQQTRLSRMAQLVIGSQRFGPECARRLKPYNGVLALRPLCGVVRDVGTRGLWEVKSILRAVDGFVKANCETWISSAVSCIQLAGSAAAISCVAYADSSAVSGVVVVVLRFQRRACGSSAAAGLAPKTSAGNSAASGPVPLPAAASDVLPVRDAECADAKWIFSCATNRV